MSQDQANTFPKSIAQISYQAINLSFNSGMLKLIESKLGREFFHQFAVNVNVSAEDGFQFTLYAIVYHNKSKWYVELVFSKRILLNITYLKRTVSDTKYRFLQLPLR